MEAKMGVFRGTIVNITQNVREILNVFANAISKPEYKSLFEEYSNITLSHFEALNKRLGTISVGGIASTNSLVEKFKTLDPLKQQEFIDMLLKQMEEGIALSSEQSKVMN